MPNPVTLFAYLICDKRRILLDVNDGVIDGTSDLIDDGADGLSTLFDVDGHVVVRPLDHVLEEVSGNTVGLYRLVVHSNVLQKSAGV